MTVVRHDPLPAWLVEPTDVTDWLDSPEASNGDLLDYALDLREALDRCNADKAAIREAAGSRGQGNGHGE